MGSGAAPPAGGVYGVGECIPDDGGTIEPDDGGTIEPDDGGTIEPDEPEPDEPEPIDGIPDGGGNIEPDEPEPDEPEPIDGGVHGGGQASAETGLVAIKIDADTVTATRRENWVSRVLFISRS